MVQTSRHVGNNAGVGLFFIMAKFQTGLSCKDVNDRRKRCRMRARQSASSFAM